MHNRFLFPFTSDDPLDKLTQWKEILKGIFNAQSEVVLPMSSSPPKKWGKRKPAPLPLGVCCSYVCTNVRAIRRTCMKSVMVVRWVVLGKASFPCSLSASCPDFPGSNIACHPLSTTLTHSHNSAIYLYCWNVWDASRWLYFVPCKAQEQVLGISLEGTLDYQSGDLGSGLNSATWWTLWPWASHMASPGLHFPHL